MPPRPVSRTLENWTSSFDHEFSVSNLDIERDVAVLALDGLAYQGPLELSGRNSHIALRTMAGPNRQEVGLRVILSFGRCASQQNV